MKKEDYVSLETAKMLKEVGYHVPEIKYYIGAQFAPKRILYSKNHNGYNNDTTCSAPHLYDAKKYLREVHNINILVAHLKIPNKYKFKWVYYLNYVESFKCEEFHSCFFDTYNQALDTAIQEACKILKDNKK